MAVFAVPACPFKNTFIPFLQTLTIFFRSSSRTLPPLFYSQSEKLLQTIFPPKLPVLEPIVLIGLDRQRVVTRLCEPCDQKPLSLLATSIVLLLFLSHLFHFPVASLLSGPRSRLTKFVRYKFGCPQVLSSTSISIDCVIVQFVKETENKEQSTHSNILTYTKTHIIYPIACADIIKLSSTKEEYFLKL